MERLLKKLKPLYGIKKLKGQYLLYCETNNEAYNKDLILIT
jgi:hypothetical protein